MKHGLFVLPAAFLLVVTVLLPGCGDSPDALTLEEYFAEFEAIDANAVVQFRAASADFPVTGDPFADEANLPSFQDLVAAIYSAFPEQRQNSIFVD